MPLTNPRSAGVLVPLFSLRSETSWGIGELPDLGKLGAWLKRGKLSVVATLPLTECVMGQESPYSSLSAFAMDPLYLSMDGLEDFHALGGESSLSPDERDTLERLRASPSVCHMEIRALKRKHLLRCFRRFHDSKAADGSSRASSLARFREEHRSWLHDYTLFRSLKESNPAWWPDWPPPLRDRSEEAVGEARRRHHDLCSFFEYIQWNLHEQLSEARRELNEGGVSLVGDLPFTVGTDSADVWARRDAFSLDATVGSPPDPYSPDGQDWGLPAFRWREIAEGGYAWPKARARQAAGLFDGARIDHVVGLYRTYLRPKDGTAPHFDPATEEEQQRQGEAILRAMAACGLDLVAEDLGTIPDYVRTSLSGLEVPGYRVLRWEKDGERYRDPLSWPRLSLATTGTHDTETLAAWWAGLGSQEREAFLRIPSLGDRGFGEEPGFGPRAHLAILDLMFRSGSGLLLLPIQDVFGFSERINQPGTVGPSNWSYRLPWTLGELLSDPRAARQTATIARLSERSGRDANCEAPHSPPD